MTPPAVSVIVRTQPCRTSLIRSSVASVLRQTHPDLQLVLVEDGGHSYDALVAEFADPRIKYVPLPKVGRSVAANTGLSHCNGHFVNFLDDDDLLFETHIETLLDALKANPSYRAAYSNAIELNSEVVQTTEDTFVQRESDYYRFFVNQYNLLRLLQHNLMPIQAVLFERSLFLELGGMAPDLEGLEDWLLWLTYSCAGPFLHVDRFTSLFRTPLDPIMAQSREEKIASHTRSVQEKMSFLFPTHVNLGNLRADHNEYLHLIDDLNARINANDFHLNNLRSHIETLNADRRIHESTIQELAKAHEEASHSLNQLTRSTSWKITRPLRAASRLLQRFR